jgi:hypothetical protein
MTNWHLARRDLLKQLGVGAACLPLLRAKGAFGAGGPTRTGRFIILQMSEGYRQLYWNPGVGSLVTRPLPPTLQPLDAHKGDLIVLPNMSNPGINAGGHGSYGVIYFGMGATGAGQYKEPTGPTVDQVVAKSFPKGASGRQSLNLEIQLELPPRSTTEPGGSHCFWTNAGQPINPEGDPVAVYKEIFAGGDFNTAAADPAAVQKLMAKKKSILDYVGTSLDDFKQRLGTEDRANIDSHFQAIRELETQLQSEVANASGKCASGAPAMLDVTDRAQYPNIQKAHFNLMISTLRCGVAGVVTLQHGDSSGNNINFGAFVPGLPALSKNNYKSPYRNWHDLGHNPIMDGVDHKKIVDGWFMARFAEFFAQLKQTPDVNGMLFDNSIILIGNHMQEGANHDAQRNPWMLLAGKNMRMATGQCIASDGKPVSAAMADICTAFGVAHPYGAGLGLVKA